MMRERKPMLSSYLSYWMVLSFLSSFLTALMIFFSAQTLGKIHVSYVVMCRLIGGIIIATISLSYAIKKGGDGTSLQDILHNKYGLLLVGLSAGAAWYTYFMAIEEAGKSEIPSSTPAAIVSAQFVILMAMNFLFKQQVPSGREFLGAIIMVIGIILIAFK